MRHQKIVASALALLLIAALGYGGLCAWFMTHERAFVFHAMTRRSVTPEDAGLSGIAEIRITTEDGEQLYGWWAPPAAGHGVIVLLTGKNVVLSDAAHLFGDLMSQGFGVVGIDYRGNGASTGLPSETGLRADALAAFDFARARVPNAKIAVVGESLGTWPAIALAVDRPVVGVMLNSPYASVRRLFEQRGWPLPYRLLMTDPLDSEALIGRIKAPVMILHGSADDAIPIAEARRLYAAAHEPKTMIEVAGASHAATWFGANRERALDAFTTWTSSENSK